jgi:hypothetical protein
LRAGLILHEPSREENACVGRFRTAGRHHDHEAINLAIRHALKIINQQPMVPSRHLTKRRKRVLAPF